jgi:hypothetical protein
LAVAQRERTFAQLAEPVQFHCTAIPAAATFK